MEFLFVVAGVRAMTHVSKGIVFFGLHISFSLSNLYLWCNAT